MGRTRREFFKTTAMVGAMFRAVGVSRFGGSVVGGTIPFPTQRSKALIECSG